MKKICFVLVCLVVSACSLNPFAKTDNGEQARIRALESELRQVKSGLAKANQKIKGYEEECCGPANDAIVEDDCVPPVQSVKLANGCENCGAYVVTAKLRKRCDYD